MKRNNILELSKLLIHEDSFKTIAFFAEKLHVSNKTIYNYISEFEHLLEEFNLTLHRKAGVGILLEGAQRNKTKFLNALTEDDKEQSSPEQRKYSIIEDLIMYDETVSIRRLSEEHFVSQSSIVNDLEEIEKGLSVYELKLERNHFGTTIDGTEQRKRSAKRSYIYDLIEKSVKVDHYIDEEKCQTILFKYFDIDTINVAKDMIKFVTDKLMFELDILYYIHILVQFTIMVDRIKDDHTITTSTIRPVVTELHILKTYPIAVELVQMLRDKYGITVNDLDLRWLNARIAGIYHESEQVRGNIYPDEINRIVFNLIDSLQDIFNTNLIDDQLLVDGLRKHLIPMNSRLVNNIKINNPYLDKIRKQYPAMFSAVSLAVTTLEANTGHHISNDEVSFLLIHFQAALERRRLSRKVAIITNKNQIILDLIESRLKAILPIFDVLETIDHTTMSMNYLDDFDLLITTIPVENVNIPVINISPVVTNNDLINVKNKYNQLFDYSTNYKYTYLESILDIDFIYIQEDIDNYQDIIEKITTDLHDNNYVEEEFHNSVMKREFISPTELGNGIAIPHGLDSYVNKTKVAFLTLKSPIKWSTDEVHTVILFAINFDDPNFSKQLFTDIYNLIDSNEFVSKVRKCKTPVELMELIHSMGKN